MMKNMFSKLALMMGVFASIFHSSSRYKKGSVFQPEAPVHSGGVEIQAYGKRRVYPASTQRPKVNLNHVNMVQAYARVGIIWHEGKLYWKDRAYAEANKGVRTDMIRL